MYENNITEYPKIKKIKFLKKRFGTKPPLLEEAVNEMLVLIKNQKM